MLLWWLVNGVVYLSMLCYFEVIVCGVFDLCDLVYFVLSMVAWLIVGVLLFDLWWSC